jgi:methyl-accepting chemotaxis protein
MKFLKDLLSSDQAAANDIESQRAFADLKSKVDAINTSQAVIEFNLDGTIITANDNFLGAMGYQLHEVEGKHHRIFVDAEYARSTEYAQFWEKLNRGEFQQAEYERFANGGRSVWIQASYNPIFDETGKPVKVVKFATDITENKVKSLDYAGKMEAISKAQAVIEFTPEGEIIYANDNFLNTLGYRLDEIVGKHHRIFVSSKDAATSEYQDFWNRLGRGIFDSGEYERFSKTGESVWIQATYNPITDNNGKVVKVVKFATDITEQKNKAEENAITANYANALKLCQANVMLADNDMNIIYMNDEVLKMLQGRERELQKYLPNFNVDKLIGTNVDGFHKNPSHQRKMVREITEPYNTRLNFDTLNFELTATPWVGTDGSRIGTVVEWVDITDSLKAQEEERKISNANSQVKQALDCLTANAMIADKDGNIIYMNDAVTSMMRDAESDLRKELPGFDAKHLVGENIDRFHKNPAHQRSMLSALTQTYSTQIVVGGRTFSLIANPIISDGGERLGTVVEWADRTKEVGAEKEIDAIVEAAAAGDLSRRIETTGKDGFFLNLAEGLNRLLGIADDVVADTVRIFDALAHGNLTRQIDKEYMGSFGKLKQDANSTVERLTEIITRIRESASTVTTGASEIAQGNADLSKRTESQASSLEETASSMEEMTSAVKQTSENSVHANELANSARGKAQEGGDVVSKAVDAMNEINQASKKISDIIGVIDEIAFQTNLLALNAAVEAARAGEQGRGFAVVAGEVRNLAQRSAGAAKEIKDLIRDSVDKVEAGTSLVNASGKTLSEIIGAVDRVSSMIQEISTAASEQSAGIDQVNSAVAQMDEMTQQNAALVEEATAAGEAMSGQAQEMSQLMEFFTLNSQGGGSAALAIASRAPAPAPVSRAPAPVASQGGLSVSNTDEWEEF